MYRHGDFLPPFTIIKKQKPLSNSVPPPSSSPFSRPLTTTDDLHCIIASFPLPPPPSPQLYAKKLPPPPRFLLSWRYQTRQWRMGGGEGLFNGSIKGGGGRSLSPLWAAEVICRAGGGRGSRTRPESERHRHCRQCTCGIENVQR